MKGTIVAAAMLTLGAGSLGAQASSDPDKIVKDGGVKVAGWSGRLDPRAAKQGRKLSETLFFPAGTGLHVTAGPAAIFWNKSNDMSGNYSVKATFDQVKASTHPEGYGLLIAGKDLDSPNQSYFYFLVRQDGKFLINHRANDSTVHKIVDWTANPAVKAIDASGRNSNALEVNIDAATARFLVNGTEVHSIPRATLDGGGDHSGTRGMAGIRVNHNLDIHIEGFAASKAK